jgi:cobalt/nickel transport system permease protein
VFKELLKTLGESLHIERYATRQGLLQRIDPRIKLVGFTVLTIGTVLLQSLLQMLIMMGVLIVFAVASRLPLRAFFSRTAMVLLFSVVIVLPLPFTTPGYALYTLPLGPWVIWVTIEGLYKAALFSMRVWVCGGALSLLTLTTRFTTLLQGMERLHLPRLFIQLTAMTYRYIFLFTGEVYRMGVAREARTVKKERMISFKTLRALSSMIGTLFIRAFERGEKVYQAMLARGYAGQFRSINELKCRMRDWGFGISLIIIAVLIYFAPIISPFTIFGGWV